MLIARLKLLNATPLPHRVFTPSPKRNAAVFELGAIMDDWRDGPRESKSHAAIRELVVSAVSDVKVVGRTNKLRRSRRRQGNPHADRVRHCAPVSSETLH
jgi:hypothetical protein